MANDAPQYIEIGQRLTSVRSNLTDLGQKEFALKHGFSTTQYNNWEKGTRRISVDCALTLCDAYGLTLDAIYRGRTDGVSQTASKAF